MSRGATRSGGGLFEGRKGKNDTVARAEEFFSEAEKQRTPQNFAKVSGDQNLKVVLLQGHECVAMV